MDWLSVAVVFVIVWWLVLFMVLPFGARPPDEVVPGTPASAPARPRLGLKIVITTAIAAVTTAGVVWLISSGLISLRPDA